MNHLRLLWMLLLTAGVVAAAGVSSAGEVPAQPVGKVVAQSGHNAVGAPGEVVRLSAEVLGPVQPGILGGKGRQQPVAGQKVSFAVVTRRDGAEVLEPSSAVTDAGGKASCRVRLGRAFGDYYVRAQAIDSEGTTHSAQFRLTAGLRRIGNGQEGPSGLILNEPLGLQVLDENGEPVSGVPIYFAIDGPPKGATLTPERAETDDNGTAFTFLKLPKSTGKVRVTAEVSAPEMGYVARGIHFEAMSLNKSLMIVTLLGGLAIFIFGMKLMSEGLQRVAGEKLKWILRLFTKNRFIAMFVGMTVTALIQSSSACTVMTVGFVNAGLITLKQAVGVVLGANVGTTVTGQIISFRLTDLALPAVTAGLILTMVIRNRTQRYWGQAIIGFGLLFLGMTTMSETLKPLRECPSFVQFFHGFDCAPVDGVMPIASVLYSLFIGTAMTVLIQSSSATIGLTMALAGGGLISFYTAVPIVLGDNIGTTITAILASIGTNRAARRTALAHSLFNVIGASYMIALFYVPAFWGESRQPIFLQLVQDVTSGNVFGVEPENIERHIAMAHTIFNVFNVLVFLPLIGVLVAVCHRVIPRLREEEQLRYLEPRLLNQPSIAIDQAVRELGYMANLSREAITDAFAQLQNVDPNIEAKLRRREDRIDRLQADITQYLVKLSQHHLSENEARTLAPLMHAVNDVERIGDHAENLLELALLKKTKKIAFSENAHLELEEMFNSVKEQFANVMGAIERRHPSLADKALKIEAVINRFDHDLHSRHVDRLGAGECDAEAGVVFLDIVANLEKVGDHLTNIAERIRIVIDSRGQAEDDDYVPEEAGGFQDAADAESA